MACGSGNAQAKWKAWLKCCRVYIWKHRGRRPASVGKKTSSSGRNIGGAGDKRGCWHGGAQPFPLIRPIYLCCRQSHFSEFVPRGRFMALCAAINTTDFIWIRPVLTGSLGDWIPCEIWVSGFVDNHISKQVQNFLNPCNLEKSLKIHADIYRGTYCRGGPGRVG